jgi:hypothetical protein
MQNCRRRQHASDPLSDRINPALESAIERDDMNLVQQLPLGLEIRCNQQHKVEPLAIHLAVHPSAESQLLRNKRQADEAPF